jgi:hypothetical protein
LSSPPAAEKDAAAFAVDEGQGLVTAITATDEDSSSITYTITGGDDARLFTIDPATGVLRFASTPDFDAPGDLDSDNVYQLTVGARSGDGDADSQGITVTVIEGDTPEARPPGTAQGCCAREIGFALSSGTCSTSTLVHPLVRQQSPDQAVSFADVGRPVLSEPTFEFEEQCAQQLVRANVVRIDVRIETPLLLCM